MKKFLQSCLLCLLWLVLTAQGKFEISSFTPKSQQIEPTPEGLAIAGAILSFVIILIIYRNKLRKKFEEQLRQNYNRHYAERQIKMIIGEDQDSGNHLKLLHSVLGTKDPVKIMKFSKSLSKFDQRATHYLGSQNYSVEAEKSITKARQLLNLTIRNYNIPFKCTRLLPVGQKLRCKVKLKSSNTFSNYYNGERQLEFDSRVLAQSESKIFIETPQEQGSPIEMKGIIEVHCEIERHNEATADDMYEFKLPFLAQKQGKTKNVLLLSHTQDIYHVPIEEKEEFDFTDDWYLA